MSIRNQALNFLLWYAIFAWGIWLGGTLYQMLVVVPLWSLAPPESLRAFFFGTAYNRTILHFFGPPFLAARTIPLILALALAWHLPKHRVLMVVAVACILAIGVFTIAYISPINAVLFEQAGGDRSAAELSDMVRTWIWADRIRLCVGVVAFVAILKTFRMPLP
jgi:uncharacterized membrane protein